MWRHEVWEKRGDRHVMHEFRAPDADAALAAFRVRNPDAEVVSVIEADRDTVSDGELVDFEVIDEGTVWVFRPVSQRAWQLAEEMALEPWQRWAGGAFVVDHRPARELVASCGATAMW